MPTFLTVHPVQTVHPILIGAGESAAGYADPLKTPQLVLALVVAFSMLAIVLELVRRQKLREEYSILWVGTAVVLIILALSTRVLTALADLLEAQSLVSILYFGALVFLMLVALQFSVRLTKLTFRGKTTSQRIALLEAEVEELRQRLEALQTRRADPDGEPTEPTVELPGPQVPAETPRAAAPRNRI